MHFYMRAAAREFVACAYGIGASHIIILQGVFKPSQRNAQGGPVEGENRDIALSLGQKIQPAAAQHGKGFVQADQISPAALLG